MRTIPVKENDLINLHISSINSHGQGVAKVEGFVIFVPNALPGEDCRIRIKSVFSKYAIGKVVERKNDSKLRTEPRCKHFLTCGGCQLQHIKYQGQLLLKQKNIIDAMKKNNLDVDDLVQNVIGSEKPWHYRNKVVFNVNKYKGEAVVGFFQHHSHKIVPIEHCYIINRDLNYVLSASRAHLKYLHTLNDILYIPFDKVFARMGTDKAMMAGTIGENNAHNQYESYVVDLRRVNKDIVSIFHNKSKDKSGNLSNDNEFLWGNDHIHGEIGELKFEVSPNSFFQINTMQTKKLYDVIKKYANLTKEDTVIDAYCGVGTIGMYLAGDAKKVIGIESVSRAISDANKNARLNDIHNIEFLSGDCEKVFPRLILSEIEAKVIVIDPPRKGCSQQFIKAMTKMKAEKIIYVSCNPATLARDIKIISSKGYKIDYIQPVDMFAQTSHVECVVGLCRKD